MTVCFCVNLSVYGSNLIIACSAPKLAKAAPAGGLYTGPVWQSDLAMLIRDHAKLLDACGSIVARGGKLYQKAVRRAGLVRPERRPGARVMAQVLTVGVEEGSQARCEVGSCLH